MGIYLQMAAEVVLVFAVSTCVSELQAIESLHYLKAVFFPKDNVYHCFIMCVLVHVHIVGVCMCVHCLQLILCKQSGNLG